jgi:hypothetical protein
MAVKIGCHEVNSNSSNLPSGVNFYRVQLRDSDSVFGRDSKSGAGGYTETNKFLLDR